MKLTNQRPRTDQEDTEAQTGDDNKVQTSGEKHQEARGKVSLGQEDFRVRRSETGCAVRCQEAGVETVIILSQHGIH